MRKPVEPNYDTLAYRVGVKSPKTHLSVVHVFSTPVQTRSRCGQVTRGDERYTYARAMPLGGTLCQKCIDKSYRLEKLIENRS
jgi:hypothetical protein